MMKKILVLMLLAMVAIAASAQRYADEYLVDTVYTVHPLTQEQFKEIIADYTAHDWVMRNPRPVVVDFYADWCQPCRRLQPILRDIAHHYQGEVDFYRINVDHNSDICEVFQIRSIPYLLICPMEGEPKNIMGLYPMQEYIRVFDIVFSNSQ